MVYWIVGIVNPDNSGADEVSTAIIGDAVAENVPG
jgi:hypothetical protein